MLSNRIDKDLTKVDGDRLRHTNRDMPTKLYYNNVFTYSKFFDFSFYFFKSC